MVMPTIAEVETDDSLNKLTLYEIIHKAQTAVSGFMAPTLLCSASCKSSAGNVLHLAFEGRALLPLRRQPEPGVRPRRPRRSRSRHRQPQRRRRRDRPCARRRSTSATSSRRSRTRSRRSSPTCRLATRTPRRAASSRARGCGRATIRWYYSVLSLEHTCDDLGLSDHNETTRAIKQSKRQHFADMYGLLVDGGMDYAHDRRGVWEESCCDTKFGPCEEGEECGECHCGHVDLEEMDRCDTQYLPNWPKLGDGSMDLFHGVVMNVAKLADVAISPKGSAARGATSRSRG